MQVELSEVECLNIIQAINNLMNLKNLEFIKPEYKLKFFYALSKNLRIIQEHLKQLQETKEKDEKWQEYEKKRISLCEKYAEKDEKGEAKKDNNGIFIGLENNIEFTKEINKLQTEYKDCAYINVKMPMDIYKFNIEWLPVNTDLLGVYINILYNLIEENKNE